MLFARCTRTLAIMSALTLFACQGSPDAPTSPEPSARPAVVAAEEAATPEAQEKKQRAQADEADADATAVEEAMYAPGQKKGGDSDEINKAKRKDIRKLMKVSGSGKIGIQMMNTMLGQFKRMMPDVPEKFWEEFAKEVDEDSLIELIVPIYDKHYTHKDIKKLIEFYESPIGEKMVRKMPVIMQESQAAGQQWGRQLGERVMKRLKEEGYK